jgi:hypothetical protein
VAFYLKQGDLRPLLALQLLKSDGTPQEDLDDAAAIQMRWTDPAGLVHTQDIALTDGTTAELEYEWQAGDTALVGWYRAEVVITWAGDVPQTYPPDGYFSWFVAPASGITWYDVANTAAELGSIGDEAQFNILAYVNTAFAADLFGGEGSGKLRLMRVYLAAHLATLGPGSGGNSAAGPVISETLGPASFTYASPSQVRGDGNLGSTSYGRLLQLMFDTSPARVGVLI